MNAERWFHFAEHNMLHVKTFPLKMSFLFPKNMAMITTFWIYTEEVEFDPIFIKNCKRITRV